MSDALSIHAAAREAGRAVALRIADRQYTFAALAELVRARCDALDAGPDGVPCPLDGENTLEAIVTLYALLERRVPALLVHPKLTAPERERLTAVAASAGGVDADAAAIVFTSGTSGEPRGAVLGRRALVASAQACAANLGWDDDDCWLLCMPLARVGGLSIVTRCLAARRAFALAREFDAALFPEWVAGQHVTLASLVPTMLSRVLDAHPGWTPPAHLRAVLVGGAQAPAGLLRRASERGLPIVVTYGSTETCSQVTATPYAGRHEAAAWAAGVPLPGIDVRVVDGRIEVRGPVLMSGYLGHAPLPRDAWFATGDLGEIDARGCLHVHARREDLIVTGGENAYPAEIERALEACPGIAAAGVFGVPDDVWGQTVAAALVAGRDAPSDTALADYVSARLAPYKRPRQVCWLPALPLTPAGKLDRASLPGLARPLRPLPSRSGAGH